MTRASVVTDGMDAVASQYEAIRSDYVSQSDTNPQDFPVTNHILNSRGNSWAADGDNIQDAIDDLDPSGTVWLPYARSADPLIVPAKIVLPAVNDLTIRGMGPSVTTLELADGVDDDMFELAPASDVYFLNFSNLELNGNKANNTGGNGIDLPVTAGGTVKDLQMNRVYINNFDNNAFYSDQAWGYRITDCIFERSGSDNVHIEDGNSGAFLHCRSGRAGRHGWQIHARHIDLIACETELAEEMGIWVRENHTRIIGGYVRTSSQAVAGVDPGIYLAATGDYSIVSGVTILGETGGITYHKYGVQVSANCIGARLRDLVIQDVTNANIFDNGTRTRINGLGREASGGGAPTAADWDFGDMVQDTDNPANHWVLDYDGTFRQIA